MTTKWKTTFEEFLKFPNQEGSSNLEAIMEIENKKRLSINTPSYKHGLMAEETFLNIIEYSKDIHILPTGYKKDIGFGADAKILYQKGNNSYSFFLDITTARKRHVHYLTIDDGLTNDVDEALCYKTEYFTVRFGIKRGHGAQFMYDKPVIVVYLESFVPCTGLAITHIENIVQYLMAINRMMVKNGHNTLATTEIYPNRRTHIEKFIEYLDEDPDRWGDYVYGAMLKFVYGK